MENWKHRQYKKYYCLVWLCLAQWYNSSIGIQNFENKTEMLSVYETFPTPLKTFILYKSRPQGAGGTFDPYEKCHL